MKIVILGGGVAGCSAAYYLKEKGADVLLVEKDKELGGCSRTEDYNGIPYEFGPQIMYSGDDYLVGIFKKFLTCYKPKTKDGKYHPALSIDGKLNEESIYEFPISVESVLKLPEAKEALFQLYEVNLDKPDYSNFENYVISRMGRILYEKFVKNYNIKQWKIHPRDMDAEWARFRNLTLKKNSDMFGDKWQGHPKNYNPMWDGMTEGVNRVVGKAEITDNFEVLVDGTLIDYDLVISTVPIHPDLEYVNTTILYVGVKSEEYIMPSYATSFPNSYNFVRIMDYKQQCHVESEYSLLSFEFPWINEDDKDNYVDEAIDFVNKILKRDISDLWVETRKKIYPISTKRNLDLMNNRLVELSKTNIVPTGRTGLYAYVSKDTCINMAKIISDNYDTLLSDNVEKKLSIFNRMRGKLT